MSESTRDCLNALNQVLLRCWLFGFGLLFLWLAALLLMGETIHTLHGALFGVSRHELDLIFYCGMGLLKLLVLTLFLIPWLSIKLLLRTGNS